ncbi:plasmid mobilization protein, partial [Bacteroides ovatus]
MKANKRNRIVKVRLTNLEYEELTKASKSSKCMSDYFRQRVFRKGVGLIDPKEFIRS